MPGDIVVGPGDDCAVVRCGGELVLITEDALVEGTHFYPGCMELGDLGARAAAVAMSDIAAMGGTPRWLLLSVCAPPSLGPAIVKLGEGVSRRARAEDASLVGGNLARSDRLSISVCVVGTVDDPPLLRSGARVGDLVMVTGTLGGASLGLRAIRENLTGDVADSMARCWRAPPSRIRAGRALRGLATAAIDVSDGLIADLCHISSSSCVGARIELSRLPLPPGYGSLAPEADPFGPALQGGEDYELVLAVPEGLQCEAQQAARAAGTELTSIGRFVPYSEGVGLLDGNGKMTVRSTLGWDHFESGGSGQS